MQPLAETISAFASIALVGICKNAGKTTVLNALLSILNRQGVTAAITSVGRDGEPVDVVTGTSKPGIWVRRGSLFVTASGLLRACDVTREIIGTTGFYTPLGEVALVRALSDGVVQLAGPSVNAQVKKIVAALFQHGADRVVVDGAMDRKTFGSPAICDAVILCSGASASSDMETVVRNTAYACELLTLPKCDPENQKRRIVPGAVTDRALREMKPSAGDEVVAQTGGHFLLDREPYQRWRERGVRFSVEKASTLCCVCVNPFSATGTSFDADVFERRVRDAAPVPVVNVMRHGERWGGTFLSF